jgi:hypothetical protein
MTHPDSDTLLKYTLRILDGPEESIVQNHLSTCEQCRVLQQDLQGEVKMLGGVNLHIGMPEPPRLPRRSRVSLAVSRLAAVLVLGFLMGYVTAQLSDRTISIPVQQRLIPVQLAVPSSAYIPCQAVDLKTMRLR